MLRDDTLGSLGGLLLLAGLGYLGFYVFGVVMGVFSPFEMFGFSVLAVVVAAAYAVTQSACDER